MSQGNNDEADTSQPALEASGGRGAEVTRSDRGRGGDHLRSRGSDQMMSGGRGSDQMMSGRWDGDQSQEGGQPPQRGRGRGQQGTGGRGRGQTRLDGGRDSDHLRSDGGRGERLSGAQMRHKFGNGVNGGDKPVKVS